MFYEKAALQAVQARKLMFTERAFPSNEWDQNILEEVNRASARWMMRPTNINSIKGRRLRYEVPKAIEEMYEDILIRSGVWV